jgi:hypothetical protein
LKGIGIFVVLLFIALGVATFFVTREAGLLWTGRMSQLAQRASAAEVTAYPSKSEGRPKAALATSSNGSF